MATVVVITSVILDSNSFVNVVGTVNGTASNASIPLTDLRGFPSLALMQDYLALQLCARSAPATPLPSLLATVNL